jgi:LPS-assembly protein
MLCPVAAGAQLPEIAIPHDREITIDADSISYDQRTGVAIAEGHVEIRHGETLLTADEVRVNQETKDAEARGRVRFMDPEGVLFADRMRLNLEEETGSLENAEIHSHRLKYSLWGDRIEKGLGQSYRIENGRFTTCQCEEGPPSWSIAGDLLTVDLDGYGDLHGATFNILDTPVLYMPRLKFPVHRERQSGLLFPRLGVSNRRGLQVLQPLYWAISKSQDATVSLDVETAARFGLLGEYRYAASESFRGQLTGSYFNEAVRGRADESSTAEENEPDIPENRWGFITEHSQAVGPAVGYADLLIVGDDLFLREMNVFSIDHREDIAFRTLPFTQSRVGAIQSWNRLVLQAEGVFSQDLIGDDDLALQRAPEARLTGQKRIGLLLLTQLNANTVNFQREEGIAGFRADLRPKAQMRLPLGRSFFGSVRAGFMETAYVLTEDEMRGGFRGDGDPDEIVRADDDSRELVEIGADLGTGLSRVFDFRRLGFDKIKHAIEPKVEFLYIPSVSQDDLPIFDGLDRINRRSLITYGFSTRLLGRSAPTTSTVGEVAELTRLSISQSYDVDRLIPPVDGTGSADHFSDIDVALRINPSRRASVRLRSNYDTSSSDLSAATVAIHWRALPQPASDSLRSRILVRTSLNLAYRFFSNNPQVNDEFSDVQQFDASVVLPLTDRFGLLYANRYDIPNDRFLENHFGVRLVSACDCWSLDLGFTDKANPNEVELRLRVTLVGLGTTGTGSGPFEPAY